MAKVSIDFRTLRAAFNKAEKYRMLNSNPFDDCEDVKIPEREPAVLTEQEFNHLLRFVKDDYLRSVIIFAVNTMMRASEIVNSRWEDIDWGKGFIHLRNRDDFTLKGKRNRSVPLNERTQEVLRRLPKDSPFIFNKVKILNRPVASISRRFKKCVRKAGLSEKIHFHSLRHTGATWLSNLNIPIEYIQKILGHTNLSTTMIYLRRDDEYLRAAVRKMDSIMLN